MALKQFTLNVSLGILLSILAFSSQVKAQNSQDFIQLSPYAKVTVLTCDPGPQLYARFGHSAIGIHDPANGVHIVYNYGTFSFNTPGFYRKFASGKLNYKLGREKFERFKREYIYEGRKVIEEELNLSIEQRQKVFNYLQNNYKPENRYYQYDFLFDNCATRITDVLEATLGEDLVFTKNNKEKPQTFRDLLNEAQEGTPWSKWGIAFLLGSVIDREASPREKTFIPLYLHYYIQQCTVNGKPLVKHSEEIIPSTQKLPTANLWNGPVLWFWLLFIVVAIISFRFRQMPFVVFDRILFITFGIIGLLVFLMWFATDHDAAAGNLNILWATPLYLVLAFFIRSNINVKIVKPTVQVFLVLNSLVIFGWYWLPQNFNPANIPLIAILILRLLFIHLNINRMEPVVVK